MHEALHLSEKENTVLPDLVRKIEIELQGNLDKHSQDLIVETENGALAHIHAYVIEKAKTL